MTTQTSPTLEFLTRPGCHLCDNARETVRTVAAECGVDVTETNIDDDHRLTAEYGEEIPVVLIDGSVHTYWWVDAGRLRSALHDRGLESGANGR